MSRAFVSLKSQHNFDWTKKDNLQNVTKSETVLIFPAHQERENLKFTAQNSEFTIFDENKRFQILLPSVRIIWLLCIAENLL